MHGIVPPAVEPGDEVAVLAPSRRLPASVVDRGVERLRTFDMSPRLYPSVLADAQLSPAERAAEVHEAFESDASAGFAVTGGEDQLRLLRHLDPDRLRANPTRFFGISDNTILHLALSAAGVVSYYGCQFVPGLALDTELPGYTDRYLRRALFDETLGAVEPADEWTDDYFDFDTDAPREWEPNPGWTWAFPSDEPVSGPLWGGCVVVLEHFLAVDRFVPEPTEGFVLALETSELLPDPYTVQSVLRCLGERGFLERAAGVVVGRPKTRHREARSDAARREYRETQRAAITETCRTYQPDVPILFDLDFGHTDPQLPVPIGGHVELDPVAASVAFAGGR
ncbi:S66 family peptidase [Haloarchaeobius salinus]|uniref:S66 family peptidase n=1 Tax=Haloarchaeobius salinus TaxID=1198298 RepID=UPI00210CC56B|nr:S66 peptidase family protein [Haloarchaeobius salinus]